MLIDVKNCDGNKTIREIIEEEKKRLESNTNIDYSFLIGKCFIMTDECLNKVELFKIESIHNSKYAVFHTIRFIIKNEMISVKCDKETLNCSVFLTDLKEFDVKIFDEIMSKINEYKTIYERLYNDFNNFELKETNCYCKGLNKPLSKKELLSTNVLRVEQFDMTLSEYLKENIEEYNKENERLNELLKYFIIEQQTFISKNQYGISLMNIENCGREIVNGKGVEGNIVAYGKLISFTKDDDEFEIVIHQNHYLIFGNKERELPKNIFLSFINDFNGNIMEIYNNSIRKIS